MASRPCLALRCCSSAVASALRGAEASSPVLCELAALARLVSAAIVLEGAWLKVVKRGAVRVQCYCSYAS